MACGESVDRSGTAVINYQEVPVPSRPIEKTLGSGAPQELRAMPADRIVHDDNEFGNAPGGRDDTIEERRGAIGGTRTHRPMATSPGVLPEVGTQAFDALNHRRAELI